MCWTLNASKTCLTGDFEIYMRAVYVRQRLVGNLRHLTMHSSQECTWSMSISESEKQVCRKIWSCAHVLYGFDKNMYCITSVRLSCYWSRQEIGHDEKFDHHICSTAWSFDVLVSSSCTVYWEDSRVQVTKTQKKTPCLHFTRDKLRGIRRWPARCSPRPLKLTERSYTWLKVEL